MGVGIYGTVTPPERTGGDTLLSQRGEDGDHLSRGNREGPQKRGGNNTPKIWGEVESLMKGDQTPPNKGVWSLSVGVQLPL